MLDSSKEKANEKPEHHKNQLFTNNAIAIQNITSNFSLLILQKPSKEVLSIWEKKVRNSLAL